MRNIKEMDKRLDEREQEIERLQQENKQLKEQLEYLRSNEYLNQVKCERTFNEELVKDLQQRIDKAIEYIKNHNLDFKRGTTTRLEALTMQEKELLTILGDKENE